MKWLTENELNKLSTKRLLSYKKKHFSHRWDNLHGSDCGCYYCLDCEDDRNEYNKMYETVKNILKGRENV